MGRRKLKSQEQLFLAPRLKSPRHPFFKQLNALQAKVEFDPWIEQRCLTNSHRLRRSLQGIRVWYRSNCHLPLGEEHNRVSRKLRSHDAYYGITWNQRSLQAFREQVHRIWRTWLSRRNRQDRITWENFARLEKRYSLPLPGSPLDIWSLSEPVTRGTGCFNCARLGPWEPGASNLPRTPSHQGDPAHIRSDNGAEFTAKTVRNWLQRVEMNTLSSNQ